MEAGLGGDCFVISNVCYALNYLSDSKVGGLPLYVVFLPFVLILIPLATVDKAYWERIEGKKFLASFFLLDFVNYPTTAITTVISVLLWCVMGYMHRYCIIVFQG
jgi:hypothetical protein